MAILQATLSSSSSFTEFSNFINTLNASPGYEAGIAWIDGVVTLDIRTNVFTTKPMSIRGKNGRGTLIVTNKSSISWEGPSPLQQKWAKSEMDFAFSRQVAGSPAEDGIGPIKRGDWIMVRSTLPTPNSGHHMATPTNRITELHQVVGTSSDATKMRAFLGDFIPDDLYQGGKYDMQWCKFPLKQGFVIADLDIIHNGLVDAQTLFRIIGFKNVTIENVTFNQTGPGAIWVRNCTNFNARGVSIEGADGGNNVYGFVVCGACNGVVFDGCRFQGTRHSITTSADADLANLGGTSMRYGQVRNMVVRNCDFFAHPHGDAAAGFIANVVADTHAEGWGTMWIGNTFNVAAHLGETWDPRCSTSYGLGMRSRAPIIKRNVFVGNGRGQKGRNNGTGVNMCSADAVIEGNLFQGLMIGVMMNNAMCKEGSLDNNRVIGNRFIDVELAGVDCWQGSNHVIDSNTFDNCGQATWSYYAANGEYCYGLVVFRDDPTGLGSCGTTGHRVTGNSMTKGPGAHRHSVSVHDFGTFAFEAFSGNNLCGYGNKSMGIHGTTAKAQTDQWMSKNQTG
jgi:hypothetical protein